MPESELFRSTRYQQIEQDLLAFFHSQPAFLDERAVRSPRAVGDAVHYLLQEDFRAILGDAYTVDTTPLERRAMADLAFEDGEGFRYSVDVKTHNLATSFNRPNLTSVERLARLYENDKNYFVLLVVKYVPEGAAIRVQTVHFIPIEFLAWSCLTVGLLGWGQIQLANANTLTINPNSSRRQWMLEMCEVLERFYPNEITKITRRIEYFARVKERWLGNKED